MDFFQTIQKETNYNCKYEYVKFKTGDFVKVIGSDNSKYNIFKGYIGEIKKYVKGHSSALVFLHPISNLTIIQIPVDQLQIFLL